MTMRLFCSFPLENTEICLACTLELGSVSQEMMICANKHHAQYFAFCGGDGNSQRVSSVMSVLSDTPWPTGSLTFHHGEKAPNISVQRQESWFLPKVGSFEDFVHEYSLTWPFARHAGHQRMFMIKALHMAIADCSICRNHSD